MNRIVNPNLLFLACESSVVTVEFVMSKKLIGASVFLGKSDKNRFSSSRSSQHGTPPNYARARGQPPSAPPGARLKG